MTTQMARLILEAHRRRAITGRVLLCGRQTLNFSVAEARALLAEQGIPARDVPVAVDTATRGSAGRNYIRDDSFFALFTDAAFSALDVTDYEGADVIHDMNRPVPAALEGQFDFIYNGSCMDNTFDPVSFLKNTSRLLRPGGRILHIESSSLRAGAHGAYLMYSPDWFFDYYAVNRFADCQVYLALWKTDVMQEDWHLFHWSPVRGADPATYHQSFLRTHLNASVLCLAERGEGSTWDVTPIQAQYRPSSPEARTCLDFATTYLRRHEERRQTQTIVPASGWGRWIGQVRTRVAPGGWIKSSRPARWAGQVLLWCTMPAAYSRQFEYLGRLRR